MIHAGTHYFPDIDAGIDLTCFSFAAGTQIVKELNDKGICASLGVNDKHSISFFKSAQVDCMLP